MKELFTRTYHKVRTLFCVHEWEEVHLDIMSRKKTCIKCKAKRTEFYI